MSRRAAEVVSIPQERLCEVVGVLSRAFAADPLMRYLFAHDKEAYSARLRAFCQYSCEVQIQLGWPLLGVVPRTRVAGAVCVAPPEQPEWPQSLLDAYTRLTSTLGPATTERLEQYVQNTGTQLPPKPLYHIGMIGVRPESQGQGYARLLLDAVHQLSEQHPSSTGVGLDTENRDNVPLYERMGYHVVAEVPLDKLKVWCMFRPNGAEA